MREYIRRIGVKVVLECRVKAKSKKDAHEKLDAAQPMLCDRFHYGTDLRRPTILEFETANDSEHVEVNISPDHQEVDFVQADDDPKTEYRLATKDDE